jgi:hypothetical protein
MLRFRKRRVAVATTEVGCDVLQIRNLLDDPRLRSLMGDAALAAPATPVHLDWGRPGRVHRPRFGRRVLLRAA